MLASLYDLLEHLCNLLHPQSYLEIGVAKGDSLKTVLKNANIQRLVLVDNWQAKKVPNDFSHVDEILEQHNFGGEVEKYSESSITAVPKVSGEFDLILVDGYHGYDVVKTDILNCLPLLANRGLMVAHDYVSCIGVREAFDKIEFPCKLVCKPANAGLITEEKSVKDEIPNVSENMDDLPQPWTGKKLK